MANPTEQYPNNATIQALNGTTDGNTGLVYIANNTSPSTNPSLQIQIDRNNQRANEIIGTANQGRVVQVTSTTVGVYSMLFSLQGTALSYAGTTSQAISTTNGTYYIYLTNVSGTATLNVVASGTGYPADKSTFIYLAEVTVASNVISSVLDTRNRSAYTTASTAGAASTGTTATTFVLDSGNVGAANSVEFKANRGSTGNPASLKWNASTNKWEAYIDDVTPTFATVKANVLESAVATGTAPLTVASTTAVTNLNADKVDGIDVTAPAAANGVAYSSSTSAQTYTAAATAGDVLYANGSAVPTWGAKGTTSGVQTYDADLDAVAALATTGMAARTASNTWTTRTLTAGNSITVTNGDGVSGNPTIDVTGITNHCVAVGTSPGGITPITAGTSNTVLAGNTGADPAFRQIVNADISNSANIDPAKLSPSGIGILMSDGGSPPEFQSVHGECSINEDGVTALKIGVAFSIGSLSSHNRDVTISLKEVDTTTAIEDVVRKITVWFGNSAGSPDSGSLYDDWTIDDADTLFLRSNFGVTGYNYMVGDLLINHNVSVLSITSLASLTTYCWVEYNGRTYRSNSITL